MPTDRGRFEGPAAAPRAPLLTRHGAAAFVIASLLAAAPARAQTSTVPGSLTVSPTQVAAGVEWFIEGDTNLDCGVATTFRPAAGGAFRQGQPLLRVEPGSFNSHNVDPGNLLAGSLFDLAPDTDYEVRLVLFDPDGGAADTTVAFRTRGWPSLPPDPRFRHVVPGSGGGSGTLEDPFRGIAAADQAAAPGDVFLLAPGIYTDSLDLVSSGTPEAPIVWSGDDPTQVIIDGQGLPYSVIELTGTHDVQFRNLMVRNPWSRCVLGDGTRNIAFIGCRIDFSTLSGHEMFGLDFREAAHENLFVSGCEVVGPIAWADGRHDDHYGVIAIGTGHVIRYNRIHGVYDAVSLGGDRDAVVTSNCDLYGNELFDCTDDGVEFDAARHNIRCFDNRITNVLVGFSCQPVYGGPIYMIRNVVYNWQLKPLKFHGYPTGMLVFHNTMIGADPRGWGGGEWRRAILRNNLILGGSHAGESGQPICIDTRGLRADLDHDGWYQADPARFARWNGLVYATLEAFQAGTGFEIFARLVEYSAFVGAEEPELGPYLGLPTFFPPYPPGAADLRLAAGSTAIDAGVPLSNINDGFLNAAPDLGAYEEGQPVPEYGPLADLVSGLGQGALASAAPAIDIRVSPSPARGSAHIMWDPGRDEGADARVAVFDVVGRRVCGATLSGASAWTWDGQSDAGEPAPTGRYYARVVVRTRVGGTPFLWIH